MNIYKKALKLKKVIFFLGSCKLLYFNMNSIAAEALEIFEEKIKNGR